jgi:hypothetical protein
MPMFNTKRSAGIEREPNPLNLENSANRGEIVRESRRDGGSSFHPAKCRNRDVRAPSKLILI